MKEYADLILENAGVITWDPLRPQPTAVAVRDGKIIFVGDLQDAWALKTPQTQVIDCQKKTLVPGFIDAHCHFFALVRKFLCLDLSPTKVKSIEDIKEALRHQAMLIPPGRWIIGVDYNDFYLTEKRQPLSRDLDEASPQNPVMIIHRSMHACVLNSPGMREVDIYIDTEEPPGGRIERDLETGEPNGLLYEMVDYVQRKMKIETSSEELDRGIKTVDRYYLSMGITSIGEATVTNDLPQWETYRKMISANQIHSRITMMPGWTFRSQFQRAGMFSGSGDDRLKVGPLKIVLSETTGKLYPEQEDLNDIVFEAARAGFQLAIHAVETSTVEAAIRALESSQRRYHQLDARCRIEHASECPPELRQRLTRLKAVIVSQPSFLYYSGERYLAQVTAEIQPYLYTFKSWLDCGLTVAGSSDSPVVPASPLMGIYSAVTRRTESGQTILPGECISAEDALRMFTVNAAFAASEENIKGSIAPGKLADLVLLSQNPLTCSPEQIKDIEIEMTFIGGQIVWEK